MERTLLYLQENGESRAMDIRRKIGLDEHCKGTDYADRSNYTLLSVIIPRLTAHGLVKRTKRGFYDLTRPWLRQWDEIPIVDDKNAIILTNLEEVGPKFYASLVDYDGMLSCLRYQNDEFELLLDPNVWGKWYEESFLIQTAIKYDLTWKFIK
jgi:hypothetical protein